MRVKEDLKIYVTVNKWVSENEILNTIKNNKNSILRMYEKQKDKNDPNIFKCLGEEYKIV